MLYELPDGRRSYVIMLCGLDGFTSTVEPPSTSSYFESRSVGGEEGGGVGNGSKVQTMEQNDPIIFYRIFLNNLVLHVFLQMQNM